AAVRNAHLLRARALLVQGKTAQAQEELRHAGGGPASYRALARLPGGMTRALLWVRRNVTRARSVLKPEGWRRAESSMGAGDGAKSSAKAARRVVALYPAESTCANWADFSSAFSVSPLPPSPYFRIMQYGRVWRDLFPIRNSKR